MYTSVLTWPLKAKHRIEQCVTSVTPIIEKKYYRLSPVNVLITMRVMWLDGDRGEGGFD